MAPITTLVWFVICIHYVKGWEADEIPFQAADYYWPMKSTNSTRIQDKIQDAQADLYGVQFTSVRRLGFAASLYGQTQWIGAEADEIHDCLAFELSSCFEKAIALSFWLRVRSAKRILATGSYTNSTRGPGILIRYDGVNEMLKVEFASTKRHWSVQLMLRKHSWYHVTAGWSIENGLSVVLDGQVNDPQAKVNNVSGAAINIIGRPYVMSLTIGRPRRMANIGDYGNFDISQFVIYFRSLTNMEMEQLPRSPLKAGTQEDLDCCSRKEADPCYSKPCMSRDCIDIEKKYSECICLDLKHKICNAYPTTAPSAATTNKEEESTDQPRTQEVLEPKKSWHNCDRLGVDKPPGLQGCGNRLDNIKRPLCKSNLCYYGVCRTTNGITECHCPTKRTCIKFEKKPVCGSDGLMYINSCVMKRASCFGKKRIVAVAKRYCDAIIKNASHYWPLSNDTEDSNGKPAIFFRNNIKAIKADQLGSVLDLDGEDDWVDIKNINDACVSMLECPNGLSVGFWMNFSDGDYILMSGGYAGYPVGPPGIRLQRDDTSKLYKLEVGTSDRVWRLYIYKFPKNWFHFSFTWNPKDGLKLYFDGKLKLTTDKPEIAEKVKNKQPYSTMVIARRDNMGKKDTKHGKLQIAHLAIWKATLSDRDIRQAYRANIKITQRSQMCCFQLRDNPALSRGGCDRFNYPKEWLRAKQMMSKCICPNELDLLNRRCKELGHLQDPTGHCSDMVDTENCRLLSTNQYGFCNTEEGQQACSLTCEQCKKNKFSSASRKPKQHHSQNTVIFASLGCIGGVIALLVVTVYFWKIYRTRRYHGAFVPPVKTVSLLDVSDYDDEKWPNKYIDSAAYFIKDVPPKKRALPLIPARTTQSNYRYQPPDFD